MTLRYSTGFRNHITANGSFKSAFQNGRIEIYSGSQPATADSAVSGSLLVTITDNNGAFTAETQATGTVTIGGSGGSVNTLTVNGIAIIGAAVAWNVSTTQTASDLADAINAYRAVPGYTAAAVGAVVTIKAALGLGTSANGWVVATTVTTLTATPANMASGVNPVNGLKWGAPAAGVITKLASQTWEGTNGAGGVAGWYRMYGAVADAGAADATGLLIREDGAISTSGQQLNMSGSTTLTNGAKTTIPATSWSRTAPASA